MWSATKVSFEGTKRLEVLHRFSLFLWAIQVSIPGSLRYQALGCIVQGFLSVDLRSASSESVLLHVWSERGSGHGPKRRSSRSRPRSNLSRPVLGVSPALLAAAVRW